MIIFVYGTLKKGFGNNYLLLNSKFITPAYTVNNFVMYNVGFPIVTFVTEKTKSFKGKVTGEVYEIDKDNIKDIDNLEGHPQWYRREKIKLSTGNLAWIYLQKPSQIESFADIILPRNGLLTFGKKMRIVE